MDRSDDGLPIGMQIIALFLEDCTSLAFAALIEQRISDFVPPPG
jgi:Asp-tRNA(Asn)/Glu-tRNA(Gln) amidotransferase A subunit family amidase